MEGCKVCPVCTLYLRPGITLKNHLSTHPKQKVIEALLKFTCNEEAEAEDNSVPCTSMVAQTVPNVLEMPQPFQENRVFFYQRMTSTTNSAAASTISTNTSNQQYIIPTVLNPQMLPYVYQQQQQFIMTSGQILAAPSSAPFEVLENTEPVQECIEEDKACQTVDLKKFYCFQNSEIEPEPVFLNDEIDYEVDGATTSNYTEEPNDEQVEVKGAESFDLEDGSTSATNIRTDEQMPPRGELSGQESLGSTCEVNWNTVNGGTSYEIEAAPPYSCNFCMETFTCLLERNVHNIEKHTGGGTSNGSSMISTEKLEVPEPRFKVKKLVIKPKRSTETIDFTNKIKVEEESPVVVAPKLENQTALLTCGICKLDFSDLKELRKHKLELHKKCSKKIVTFKCTTCNETFPNDYTYTVHLKVHPLECYLCGKLFYRRQNMELHMKRHLGIRPHKCDFCGKAFLTKQKMLEHKNVHTGEAPVKCNECNESFKRYSNLVQHRNRHHLFLKRKVRDYVCQCGEYFHSSKKLAWHKETHDVKPKSCLQCSEKFVHAASLTRHVRKAHDERYLPQKNRVEENVECPVCKGVFIRSSLDVHMRTHNGTRPFTCSICNRDFTTKWNLKLHQWTHASRVTKPFKCDQCNGAFVRECDYKSHMNAHRNIKPYTCNHCGARFIRKSNCARHVKEHETAKTYKCDVCPKTFHRSDYLKDHMRVHTGDRPYTCHVCGKTSTTKSNHNKHIQIHHARETVTTEN